MRAIRQHGSEMRASLLNNAGQLAIFMTNVYVVLLENLVIDVVLD